MPNSQSSSIISASVANPHALNHAQDDAEMFEVMKPPRNDFDMFLHRPQSTGQRKARKMVHRDGDWHSSVHVWLVCKDQVVLQKRSADKDTFPNQWDISAAGHIEYGADSRESAVREVTEELGVECTKEELIYGFTCPSEQAPLGGCNCFEDVYFLFRDKDELSFSLGTAEVTDVKWMEISDLKRALKEGDDRYVPKTKQYTNAFFTRLQTISESTS